MPPLQKTKPRLTYCGLTVILSNPSRFDTVSLLSGTGGGLFNDFCLRPDNNVMQVEVRLADDFSPFLPNTKAVLLCGQYAMHKWLPETKNNTINEMRGSPFIKNGMCFIPTFFPQDAADFRAYEQQLNVLSKEYSPDADEYRADDDEGDVKSHGATARRNYAFWLRADTNKAKRIIANGGKIPASPIPEPCYHILPSSADICKVLRDARGMVMWFDIETDYVKGNPLSRNLQCFSFSFNGVDIYAVPVLDYNYRPYYSDTHKILQALAIAVSRNTVVAHNGAAFDFTVLAYKYRMAVGSCYDTMLAMHRCFPDVEKSLGHCVSYWTYEKFHKSEDSDGYFTRDQMIARLRYCAKDVRTMFLVHTAIEAYAKTVPGLSHSIQTAMNSIKPYLITSIQGIRYKADDVLETMRENDRLMMQYMRCIKIMIGDIGMQEIASLCKKQVSKLAGFPGSNKQCCIYFHDILGYPVVARSKKTQEPSLAKQAMYKLALKHDNPVIQFTLAFRKIQKEYGTLAFIPWKDDNGKIIIQPTDTTQAPPCVPQTSGGSNPIVANDDANS